jgi:hypothetical protein
MEVIRERSKLWYRLFENFERETELRFALVLQWGRKHEIRQKKLTDAQILGDAMRLKYEA